MHQQIRSEEETSPVYYSVLQCVAVCCSVLQFVAHAPANSLKGGNSACVLQCVPVRYSVLQCVVACCIVLHCVAVYHSEIVVSRSGLHMH